MFLLGATTRGYLRTAHRIAIRNVHLCPPHVLRNRAGESALDAVFEVGDTNAGQSEPEDWTCPYSRLARHTGEFTGLHAIKRSKDDAKVRHISNESCNADQLTQASPSDCLPLIRHHLGDGRSSREASREQRPDAGERSSYGTDRLIFRSSQPAEVLERARAVLQVVLARGRYGLVTLELAVLG